MHPVDIHVGKRLRLRRNILALSQNDLGKMVGVTFQQIQKYERGVNRIGASRLYDFAKSLGVEVGYFYEGFDCETENALPKVPEILNRETITLVREYNAIEDQQARRSVMTIVKQLSGVHAAT